MGLFSKKIKVGLKVSPIILASVLSAMPALRQLSFLDPFTKAQIVQLEKGVEKANGRHKFEANERANAISREFNHKIIGFIALVREVGSELIKLDRSYKHGKDIYHDFYRQVQILKNARSDLKDIIKELKIIRATLPKESSGFDNYKAISRLIKLFGDVGREFTNSIKQAENRLKELR